MENRMPRFTKCTGGNSGGEEATAVPIQAMCNLSLSQILHPIPTAVSLIPSLIPHLTNVSSCRNQRNLNCGLNDQ